MAVIILLFASFHMYFRRWGVRTYWRQVYVELSR
jgi:hypothetical protein